MKRKFDVPNSPENLGWLALYVCICKKMSPADALKAMGIKVLHKSPNSKLLNDE